MRITLMWATDCNTNRRSARHRYVHLYAQVHSWPLSPSDNVTPNISFGRSPTLNSLTWGLGHTPRCSDASCLYNKSRETQTQHAFMDTHKYAGSQRTHGLRASPSRVPVQPRHVDLRFLRPHREDVGRATAQRKRGGAFPRGPRGGVPVLAGRGALR